MPALMKSVSDGFSCSSVTRTSSHSTTPNGTVISCLRTPTVSTRPVRQVEAQHLVERHPGEDVAVHDHEWSLRASSPA